MLRIAVPNKGSLSEPAAEMLREAGYKQRRDSRELVLPDPDNDVEFFFLRPRDIAVYVGAGTVDVGITGRDLMLDSESAAVEHLPLGFARSTFRFAGAAGEWTDVAQVAGRRVATSYPVLVARLPALARHRARGRRAPGRCGRVRHQARRRRRDRGRRRDRHHAARRRARDLRASRSCARRPSWSAAPTGSSRPVSTC